MGVTTIAGVLHVVIRKPTFGLENCPSVSVLSGPIESRTVTMAAWERPAGKAVAYSSKQKDKQ